MTDQPMTSFVAEIVRHLATFAKDVRMPDQKHNVGRLLAQTYFWDVVEKHAKKQSEQLWDTLRAEGHIPEKEALKPGEHTLTESPHLVCSAKVTQPVNRFDPSELAILFKKSKYKVPEPITRELVEKAKVPKKSQVTLSIAERGM